MRVKKYNVPAIEKAMAILNLLAESDEEYSVTEIHTKLDIPKATVFMILSVLESYDMIRKDRNGRYSLGSKIYMLGMAYMSKMDIKSVARPHLEQLMQDTKFCVHLGILVDHRVLFVDKVEPPTFIKFNTFPGMRLDIHTCSLGKAISAFLPEEEVDAAIASVGMGRYTPNTITDPDKFKQVLHQTRVNGFAIEDEEGELGVRCIGAPVFDHEGKVVAAVSITALKADLPVEMMYAIGVKVKEAADRVSGDLGYVPEQPGPDR